MALVDDIRAACARVAARARFVQVVSQAIPAYAALLGDPPPPDPDLLLLEGGRERRAAAALQWDAVNFGSGWHPTLRKRPGRSGSITIAAALRAHGPWDAAALQTLGASDVAAVFGQDPGHELMGLFAASLNDLGRRVSAESGGSFTALVDAAGSSAVALAERLAGWDCFHDVSVYDGDPVPFAKRAQIACADLAAARVAEFGDLDRLTLFADNLIPHVLRLDGVLDVDPGVVVRIEREELLEHGSPEEVELRACAVHAVELIVQSHGELTAADVDNVLWRRGQGPRYKARPRPRVRCTAY